MTQTPASAAPLFRWKERLNSIRDWQLALILTIICVVSRALALPASFWEWDDILFARALHRFDIPSHSPHPPGFPVFVFMARAVNLLVHNDHLALAMVSLLLSSTLGAALFYLFRAIFADRSIAFAASLMTMFAPAVWIHSGAARSDEPAFAVGIICAATILHGRTSSRALIIGSALFGIGMGIRVTLLPLIAPILTLIYLMRLRRGGWKLVLGCVLLGCACGASWYVPMVVHTGWQTYREVLHQHSTYWFATDAFFSPGENSDVSRRLTRFFIDVWGSPRIALTLYLLAGLALGQLITLGAWRMLGWLGLTFLPFLVFTTLLNTPLSAPLYGLGYLPLFTGLAAAGLVLTARRFSGRNLLLAKHDLQLSYRGIACAILAAISAGMWSYPAIRLLRKNISPPVQAMQFIRQHLDPKQDMIFYNGYFTPHVSYYLPDFKVEQWTTDEFQLPPLNLLNPATPAKHTYALGINFVPPPVIGQFRWPSGGARERLRTVSLGRYFEAKLSDITEANPVYYLDGWFPEEANQAGRWRWMSRAGTIAFLNRSASASVRVRGSLPVNSAAPGPATLTFYLNGQEVDRISVSSGQIDHTLPVRPAPAKVWSSLRIACDRTIIPNEVGLGADSRELAFQCTEITVRNEPTTVTNRSFSPSEFVGEGWYDLENGMPRPWRWAQPRALVKLPEVPGAAELDLMMRVPDGADGTRPAVTVSVDDQVIETFQPAAGVFSKHYRLAAKRRNGSTSELVLSVPNAANIPNDSRALAMCVYDVSWTPAGQN